MTDRDHFAAAALTGYNANPEWDDIDPSIVAERAYADADAMLRERERTENRPTIDGVPVPADATPPLHATPGGCSVQPEGTQPTLTDEEREAIWFFAAIDSNDSTLGKHAATLRNLLERLT